MLTESLLFEIEKRLPNGFTCFPLKNQYGTSIVIQTPQGEQRYLRIPEGWELEEHTQGFGGWILHRSKSSRFVRCLVIPTYKERVLEEFLECKIDARSTEAQEIIASLIGNDISLLTLEEQLAEEIARIIGSLNTHSHSQESQLRQSALFSKGVSDFLMKFPAMTEIGQQLPFYRNTLKVDQDNPSGIREAIRDYLIGWLTDNEIISPLNNSKFICDPTATSKNTPGTWITAIKRDMPRKDRDGVLTLTNPNSPSMLLATQPIVGNRKRSPREMGGIKHALPLRNPRPINERIHNGYEAHLSKEILQCMTTVCVAFITLEGLNFYQESIGRDEKGLNLDDILVTPEGHNSLTATINEKKLYTPEEWDRFKGLYLEGEETPRDGISIEESLIPETTIDGFSLCRKEIIVTDRDKTEEWHVGKVLLDSTHKAMVKPISHSLIAKEKDGTEHIVEVIVSAESVKEKKIDSMVLSGVLARLNYGYVENPESPGNLTLEVQKILQEKGENEDGTLPIYRVEEDGFRTYVGEGTIGYLRAVRLQENERTSSRVRANGAIPVQTPLRHLVRKPAVLDKRTEHLVNLLARTYSQLIEV